MRFITLKSLEGGTVVNIHAAIDKAMSSNDPDWTKKLVAMGSDGASVMQGKKGDVVAFLRANSPWILVGTS